MSMFTKGNNCFLWERNGETLVVEPWGENSLRVRAAVMRDIADNGYALLSPSVCTAQISVDGNRAELINGKIRAVAEVDETRNCQLKFYNQNGRLLLSEEGNGGALHNQARCFKPIIGGDFRLTMTFEANADEKLYGMGQYQQDIMNVKNCTFELAHRNSQASVPFVLSSRGYGFLWHNPAIGRATFSQNRTQWYAESTKQLDYWITAGDNPAEIVEAYAAATGKAPMMPEYGLGFWQCKLRYWNQEQLLQVAREYKRRGIPVDVIVCDFFHWPKMGDYRFDEEFFPDPRAMAEELESMGIKLMVSVWPQVALDSENFEEMKSRGYLVRQEMGVDCSMRFFGSDTMFFDATNPKARKYLWEKCKKNYYDKGVALFWLDEAEPEYSVYDFENYRYSMGPNVQIGNIYPQLYSRAFYDGMLENGQKEIVNLVRCAWAGSQRYGALVWSGDIQSSFEAFRRQICAGLQMGICGIPWWTTDIGGFYGGDPESEAFRELLIRWFQYGAFCPVMRLHGDRIPSQQVPSKDGRPVLATGGDNEVWSFGEEAYTILCRYLRLREAMRPYTRMLMREAHEKGAPVMRSMFYEFPEDDACWELKDQYMYGADILVAPVTEEGAASRKVYLPGGAQWEDAYSGQVYGGGQTISAQAPIDIIPVFLRDGKQKELFNRF